MPFICKLLKNETVTQNNNKNEKKHDKVKSSNYFSFNNNNHKKNDYVYDPDDDDLNARAETTVNYEYKDTRKLNTIKCAGNI